MVEEDNNLEHLREIIFLSSLLLYSHSMTLVVILSSSGMLDFEGSSRCLATTVIFNNPFV